MSAMQEEFAYGDEFPVSASWFHELVPMLMARARYRDVVNSPDGRSAAATRDTQQPGAVVRRETVQVVVRWNELAENWTRVEWSVFDFSMGQRGASNERAAAEFGQTLRFTVYGAPEPDPVPSDPLIGPGESFDGRFNGNLRDYSFCASAAELADFEQGKLPLGVHAFTPRAGNTIYGKALYLGGYRNGAPMLYNGVLVCAPQNSGKTQLVLRWAKAANTARFNQFIVDVKGNLYDKLIEQGWKGRIYHLTTNPRQPKGEPPSDRINFLAGYIEEPYGITPQTTERIRQLVTALLPSEGWTGEGGKDEFFYRNRVIWLTALLHILLLKQIYYPWAFKDCKRVNKACRPHPTEASRERCTAGMCERTVDLGDLYELIVSEPLLCGVVQQVRKAEAVARKKPDVLMPECGVDYWVREIALMLGPDKFPGDGQRPATESYALYTAGLKQALEPFAKHGVLHGRVKDNGSGRLFRLEDLGTEPPEEPVTILLSARDQDQINAETLLSITITRLQHLLFDRMPLKQPRPILMLLDETRRIRGFEANRYITFAREAKAGCVIVYQSLDQIGDEKKIYEILENVGTQIYLGSLVGNTARHFIHVLPKRYRSTYVENVQRGTSGVVHTQNLSRELVDCFTSNELYALPAGNYPAIVYVADQPRRKPFLVSMDEGIIPAPVTILPTTVIGSHEAAVCDLHMWPNGASLLAASAEDGMIAFDLVAATPILSLTPDNGGGQCVAVARSAAFYVTGTQDGRVRIMDNASAALANTLEAHVDAVRSVAITPDGRWILSASDDSTVAVHDAASGALIELISAHTGPVIAVRVSADGTRMATASADGTARVISLADWSELAVVNAATPITSLACSDAFDLMVIGTSEGAMVWNPLGQAISLLPASWPDATCVAVSPDGSLIAAGYANGAIGVWRGQSREFVSKITPESGGVTALLAPADGRSVIAALSDLSIRLIRIDPFFE